MIQRIFIVALKGIVQLAIVCGMQAVNKSSKATLQPRGTQ